MINVNQLEDLLSTPTPKVIETFKHLHGDIIILGVGGKIGPSLARMAKRAVDMAGVQKRIFGVSRFGSVEMKKNLKKIGIETIQGDLLDRKFISELPRVENVIFMAGKKFGSTDSTAQTWAMNVYLPGMVAELYRHSKIIVYSTGCVYPFVQVKSGGATEQTQPDAHGEYAQSCLGRERMFEYGSLAYKTPAVLIRLNYAVELRYGIQVDIARKVHSGTPIDLTMGYANMIWQGDANAAVLRSFEICESPANILNVTGPETLSIRRIADRFGELFFIQPKFNGQESETAWLSDASRCHTLFGYPKMDPDQVLQWTAKWIEKDMPILNKPTHYDTRNGKF
ncbi:NAD-dependent epimerase/dehydratase family protein [candidate division KSB1 bacterium]|nr:NAD-dependent epimerase/dehydratase family protein [candidate division KSB1 bacterium]